MSISDPRPDSKRQILDHLKRVESSSVSALAQTLGVTSTAVRQHLDSLASAGLVQKAESVPSGGRGRPATHWTLTPTASELFPDRHSDLTVELIEAMRDAIGDEGIDAVITARTARQREAYRALISGDALASRVQQLAAQRASEGYLAEVVDNDDGSFELVEHHCPICDAAEACSGLCRDELELFRDVLEPATVERTSHLLGGDSRCSYRVTPVTIT